MKKNAVICYCVFILAINAWPSYYGMGIRAEYWWCGKPIQWLLVSYGGENGETFYFSIFYVALITTAIFWLACFWLLAYLLKRRFLKKIEQFNLDGKNTNEIRPFTLSLLQFFGSLAWLCGAALWLTRNRGSWDGWSNSLLASLSCLALTPFVCITVSLLLVRTRWRNRERFTTLDWCGFGITLAVLFFSIYLMAGILTYLSSTGILRSLIM